MQEGLSKNDQFDGCRHKNVEITIGKYNCEIFKLYMLGEIDYNRAIS